MGYETKSPLLDEAALIPIAIRESGSWKQLKKLGQTYGCVDISEASDACSIHPSADLLPRLSSHHCLGFLLHISLLSWQQGY